MMIKELFKKKSTIIVTDDYISEKLNNGGFFIARIDSRSTIPTEDTTEYTYKITINNLNYNSDYTHINVLELYSHQYNPKFLLGLFNYFHDVIPLLEDEYENKAKSIVYSILDNLNNIFSNIDAVDQFLKKHENTTEFTQSLIAELFLQESPIVINEKEKKEILSEHSQKFLNVRKSVKNDNNFAQYLLPFLIKMNSDEINFIHMYKTISYKQSIEDLKFFHKIQSLHYYKNTDNFDVDILIKNYTPPEGISLNYNDNHIEIVDPVKNLKIVETINDLTIGEYNKVYNFIDFYDLTDNFIKVIQLGLEDKNINTNFNPDTINKMHNMFNTYYYNIIHGATDNNVAIMHKESHKLFKRELNKYKNRTTYNSNYRTVIEFVENSEDYNKDDVKMCTYLINNIYYMWLNNDNYYDDYVVLQELLNIMNGKKIVELLVEVINNGKSLNVKQWEQYIANYEEYKDMPVSWWMELV